MCCQRGGVPRPISRQTRRPRGAPAPAWNTSAPFLPCPLPPSYSCAALLLRPQLMPRSLHHWLY
eukprot:scaffold104134_cov33-Phaeocystis_antarctica.AAC.1